MKGFIELDYDYSEDQMALINVNHIVAVIPVGKFGCKITLSEPYVDEAGDRYSDFYHRSYSDVKQMIREASK